MSKWLSLILTIFISGIIQQASALDTETKIFNPNFKTLKIGVLDHFLSPPIITLNAGDQIVISFDEIADDFRYLQYRLVHCNADWQPSQLLESEYTDGFNQENIDDYAFSNNTFVHYVNYKIVIPNQDCQPLVSGNYLIQIFPENETEEILLQARFSVVDPEISISGEATSRTDIGFNDQYQQVNFTITQNDYKCNDPYSDLIIVVSQNGRTDNAVTLRHPQRVEGNKIIYEHIKELIFPSGNEFRRFETVRANYPGMNVDKTSYENDIYNAYLMTDHERASQPYIYDQTQHGRYMIDEYNSTDPDLGADYIMTHFTLDIPEVMNADIYVSGELSQNSLNDRYKMIYNRNSNLYELSVPLKQGSYNYQYLAIPHDSAIRIGDTSLVEGNHYETINEYTIKVFQRTPVSRADKLIGCYVVYSGK